MVSLSEPLTITLGYGKRPIDETVALLREHGIEFLVDVRSAPYSRYHPDYSRDALKAHVEAHGISYLYLGQELGGRPDDPTCYSADGRVDYQACAGRPAFRQGISRLSNAWTQGRRVALLCSESKPEHCHRSKLIAPALEAEGVAVMHVDEDGSLCTQRAVMVRLQDEAAQRGQLSLFEDEAPARALHSRRKYAPDGS
jgi:uncharacterized protein (DUF488 family)